MNLFGALTGIPLLPEAVCRGRWELFDAAADGDRYAEQSALALCAGCPEILACGNWLASLRPADRPFGVTAGRVRKSRKGRAA